MSKVKLQYKTAVMRNPATKEVYTDKRSVRIVNMRIYNLDELVRFALDNNYIEGAKYELAKGIVKGAIEAERALVLAGNSVSIDGWVKYEPRLKGSVDAEKRVLTAKDNSLAMGISALKEMKLSLDMFAWQCADEDLKPTPTPTAPRVDAINDGTFHAGGGNVVTGANMRFADAFPGNHVTITDADGQDVGAMVNTDSGTPVTEARFGLEIEADLTDGAEYTFAFDMVDADGQPATVTKTARFAAS